MPCEKLSNGPCFLGPADPDLGWVVRRGQQDLRGSHRVREIVQDAEEVLMSAVVVGELLYGFRQGPRLEQNLAELRSFLDRPYVSFVPVGPVTADRYSRIMASLRARGRPIPTNDVWIAAHAMETGADLVSADSHFGHIDQVVWVSATSD